MCRYMKLAFFGGGKGAPQYAEKGAEQSPTRNVTDTIGYVPTPPWQQYPRRGQMATPRSNVRTMTSVFLLDEALMLPAYINNARRC